MLREDIQVHQVLLTAFNKINTCSIYIVIKILLIIRIKIIILIINIKFSSVPVNI